MSKQKRYTNEFKKQIIANNFDAYKRKYKTHINILCSTVLTVDIKLN